MAEQITPVETGPQHPGGGAGGPRPYRLSIRVAVAAFGLPLTVPFASPAVGSFQPIGLPLSLLLEVK
jgi:hypothetical protein